MREQIPHPTANETVNSCRACLIDSFCNLLPSTIIYHPHSLVACRILRVNSHSTSFNCWKELEFRGPMHWIIKQLSTRLVSMKYASKVFPTNMPRAHATLRHLNRAHKCLRCFFKHRICFVNGILFAIRGNVLYSTSPRELEFKKLCSKLQRNGSTASLNS